RPGKRRKTVRQFARIETAKIVSIIRQQAQNARPRVPFQRIGCTGDFNLGRIDAEEVGLINEAMQPLPAEETGDRNHSKRKNQKNTPNSARETNGKRFAGGMARTGG